MVSDPDGHVATGVNGLTVAIGVKLLVMAGRVGRSDLSLPFVSSWPTTTRRS